LVAIVPLFAQIFFTPVILRNKEPVSSVADASCLSMTAYSGLLQTKSISAAIGFIKLNSVQETSVANRQQNLTFISSAMHYLNAKKNETCFMAVVLLTKDLNTHNEKN